MSIYGNELSLANETFLFDENIQFQEITDLSLVTEGFDIKELVNKFIQFIKDVIEKIRELIDNFLGKDKKEKIKENEQKIKDIKDSVNDKPSEFKSKFNEEEQKIMSSVKFKYHKFKEGYKSINITFKYYDDLLDGNVYTPINGISTNKPAYYVYSDNEIDKMLSSSISSNMLTISDGKIDKSSLHKVGTEEKSLKDLESYYSEDLNLKIVDDMKISVDKLKSIESSLKSYKGKIQEKELVKMYNLTGRISSILLHNSNILSKLRAGYINEHMAYTARVTQALSQAVNNTNENFKTQEA